MTNLASQIGEIGELVKNPKNGIVKYFSVAQKVRGIIIQFEDGLKKAGISTEREMEPEREGDFNFDNNFLSFAEGLQTGDELLNSGEGLGIVKLEIENKDIEDEFWEVFDTEGNGILKELNTKIRLRNRTFVTKNGKTNNFEIGYKRDKKKIPAEHKNDPNYPIKDATEISWKFGEDNLEKIKIFLRNQGFRPKETKKFQKRKTFKITLKNGKFIKISFQKGSEETLEFQTMEIESSDEKIILELQKKFSLQKRSKENRLNKD